MRSTGLAHSNRCIYATLNQSFINMSDDFKQKSTSAHLKMQFNWIHYAIRIAQNAKCGTIRRKRMVLNERFGIV